MKIVNAFWFTEMGSTKPIGIVICEDKDIGKKQAYIGTGLGLDEAHDAANIVARGARLHASTVNNIETMLADIKA